ncbi:hypothetical protein [Parvularcula dongshanensis]|uniref:hypothetical protein n=1 Tax=Parvularcula dongshanensis TaxID=1173995 RepID=UPI00161A7822|nr:hypothetical protein [Parvularcula dongshanensis]
MSQNLTPELRPADDDVAVATAVMFPVSVEARETTLRRKRVPQATPRARAGVHR